MAYNGGPIEIEYRHVNPDDYDEVYRFNLCHEYSWRDSSTTYIPDSETERNAKTSRIVAELKTYDSRYCCVAAFATSEMVGAHFLDRYEIDKRPACHIHGLWVHPSYRGKGVARKLKELGEAWAKAKGCSFMDANVRMENKAMISMNEKLGYRVERLNFRKPIR